VRDARERVEADVVFVRGAAQQPARAPPQAARLLKSRLEALDGGTGRLQQAHHALVPARVGPLLPAPLDLAQPVMQGLDQQAAAPGIFEQILLQVRVAIDHPDVAEHFEQHPRAAPGAPLLAQRTQQVPGGRTEQPDHDFAIRQRRVVVWDFAQPRRRLGAHAGAVPQHAGLQGIH